MTNRLYKGAKRLGRSLAISGIALVGTSAAVTSGATASDFYSGKQIRLVIGLGAASTYNAYARLLARHMPEQIPGKPTMIAVNMPGAGSLTAYNHLYNVAPRDGTAFGTGHRFVPMMPLLGMEGPKFEATKFNFIGSMNQEVGVCLSWHTAPVKTVKDLKDHLLVVGTTGRGAELTNFTATLKNMLGAKLKVVMGYKTTDEINLAIERGEIQGRCGVSYGSLKNARSEWLEKNMVNIFLQLGLAKDPELPNVPLLYDLVSDQRDKQALELMLAPTVMGRPFVAPPEVSAERIAILRTAFDETMKKPALRAEAKKQNLDIAPIGGQEIQKLIARLYKAPQPVVKRARELINQPK